jgi:hypothetical protein
MTSRLIEEHRVMLNIRLTDGEESSLVESVDDPISRIEFTSNGSTFQICENTAVELQHPR